MEFQKLKRWLLPEVGKDIRNRINDINVRLIRRVVPMFLALTAGLLIYYGAMYLVRGREYSDTLIAVLICFSLFFLAWSISWHWDRDSSASAKKKTVWTIEMLYWVFSAWAVWYSWQMYADGYRMMILDVVQVGFMLLVCCYPLWGAVRVLFVYGVLFALLCRFDGAVQIYPSIFFLMAGMNCFGTVLRYGMEQRNVEQRRELTRHSRSLEKSSTHDELTGMKNRVALRSDFPEYCGKELWVIMADVDHFKRYNDTYGHEIGDEVLKAVSAEIKEVFGERCTYRYGGDEFLIIQDGYSRSELTTLLVTWSRSINAIRLEELPEEDNFRCSYGYVKGKPETEEALRKMMVLADKKLYEMKNAR